MIKIFETEEELAETIALEMQQQLETKEHPVFCLASGSTPAKSYQKFVEKSSSNKLLDRLKFVSLDEWVGVESSKTGSCFQMLEHDLFQHLPLKKEQITFFETVDCDLTKECKRIDDFIKENPITFSLMGVGMNGHIGLNEPGTKVIGNSSVIPLSAKTKEVAQKYFKEPVALEKGITIGLKQVIESERVIVVITGEHKKEIVKEIVENQNQLPAQMLLEYEHIDFYFDINAAALLDNEYEGLKK